MDDQPTEPTKVVVGSVGDKAVSDTVQRYSTPSSLLRSTISTLLLTLLMHSSPQVMAPLDTLRPPGTVANFELSREILPAEIIVVLPGSCVKDVSISRVV